MKALQGIHYFIFYLLQIHVLYHKGNQITKNVQSYRRVGVS